MSIMALMLILLIACNSVNNVRKDHSSAGKGFIIVSPENPSYFQFSDGTPYIPVGINMISPGGRYRDNADSSLV